MRRDARVGLDDRWKAKCIVLSLLSHSDIPLDALEDVRQHHFPLESMQWSSGVDVG